jgi:hypothetical protein
VTGCAAFSDDFGALCCQPNQSISLILAFARVWQVDITRSESQLENKKEQGYQEETNPKHGHEFSPFDLIESDGR